MRSTFVDLLVKSHFKTHKIGNHLMADLTINFRHGSKRAFMTADENIFTSTNATDVTIPACALCLISVVVDNIDILYACSCY